MKSEFKCHICGQPFEVYNGNCRGTNDKGVTVRCENTHGCLPHENVYGYGKDEKSAVEIAEQKYKG